MAAEDSNNITIHLGIPVRRGSDGVLGGQNYTDENGKWAVRLFIKDGDGERHVHLYEGQSFEFSGGSWLVSKVFEPTAGTRRSVATVMPVDES